MCEKMMLLVMCLHVLMKMWENECPMPVCGESGVCVVEV